MSMPCRMSQMTGMLRLTSQPQFLRDSSGNLQMFDFGPVGGDVHVGRPRLRCGEQNSSLKKGSVQGEVRHTQIDTLPKASMLVGQTDVPLQDISQYNRVHSSQYELNLNDCRHYVNNIVKLCTGVPNATYRLMQHQFLSRRSGRGQTPMDHLVPPLQCLTNPDNWHVVCHSARAVGAAALLSLAHPALATSSPSSTSAVALTALHGVVAVYMQRTAPSAPARSQQVTVCEDVKRSWATGSALRNTEKGGQTQRREAVVPCHDVGAQGSTSHHVPLNFQEATKRVTAALAAVSIPLVRSRGSFRSHKASTYALKSAGTTDKELMAQGRESCTVGAVMCGGELARPHWEHVPTIKSAQVSTSRVPTNAVRSRLQVGKL